MVNTFIIAAGFAVLGWAGFFLALAEIIEEKFFR